MDKQSNSEKLTSAEKDGREDAVINQFEEDFTEYCVTNDIIGIRAPTEGKDTLVNSDYILAADVSYFMIEFKSYYTSLVRENEKKRARNLATKLLNDNEKQVLHQKSHLVAWGEDVEEIPLPLQMGIYQSIVCNRTFLPSCGDGRIGDKPGKSIKSDVFFSELNKGIYGLESDEFTQYLKFLLTDKEADGEPDFCLKIYGHSINGKTHNLHGQVFKKYSDFKEWAEKVTSAMENSKHNNKNSNDAQNVGNQNRNNRNNSF